MIQAGYKYDYYSDYSIASEGADYSKTFSSSRADLVRAQKKKMLCKVIGVFFIYAVILVYLCVKSAVLGYQIVDLEKEIHNIENENLRIQYLTENSCSLEMVEKIAINELHMVKPEQEIDVAVLPAEVKVAPLKRMAAGEQTGEDKNGKEKPLYRLYSNLAFLADKNR